MGLQLQKTPDVHLIVLHDSVCGQEPVGKKTEMTGFKTIAMLTSDQRLGKYLAVYTKMPSVMYKNL